MNTKTLEYIIAIAEEKSITQAAERFYLSQPVLSRHLKNVEEELGTPIFVRQGHQMLLTEAGIIFINNAQAILHVEKQLENKLDELRKSQKDSLILLTEPYYINFLLKRILPQFHAKFPDSQVHISSASSLQAKEALISGDATMALYTSSHLHESQLELMPLFSDELVLILPKGLSIPRTSDKTRPDWSILNRQAFYLQSPDNEFRHMENKWLDAIGVSPVTILESNSFQHSLEFVYQEQCCTFLPKERLIKANTAALQVHPADTPKVFYQVLAYPKNSTFKRPARELAQIIAEQFKYFTQYMEMGDTSH